jgi:prefoldin alpha subunit
MSSGLKSQDLDISKVPPQ